MLKLRSSKKSKITNKKMKINFATDGSMNPVSHYEDGVYYIGGDVNPYVIVVRVGSLDCADITINPETELLCTNAFENCKKVKKIELPQGIKNISRKAFLGCSSLECVCVPISVTNIGELAFSGCNSLSDIYYSGTKECFDKITKEALWDIGLNGVNIHCTDGDIYIENDSEQ